MSRSHKTSSKKCERTKQIKKKAVKKVKRYPLLESDDEELSESLDSATDAEFEEQQY